jgi:hypothetical protein
MSTNAAAVAAPAVNPPPNRPSGNSDGMSDGDEAFLAEALGLEPSGESSVSADGEAGGEQDLSQTSTSEGSPETGDAAGEESSAEEPESGSEEGEASEGDGSEDSDAAEAEQPKGLQGMQKRIDKLTARLKAAEAELEQVRGGKPAVVPKGLDPVESDPEVVTATESLAKVSADLEGVKRLKAMLRSDPKRVEDVLRKFMPELPSYDPETMKESLDEISGSLRESAAQHRATAESRRRVVTQEVAQRRERVLNLTTAEMPWIKNDDDPRYERYVAAMRDPFVASRPDASFFVAAGIEKLVAIEARQRQKAAKPSVASKPAPAKVRPAAAGVAAPPKAKVQDRQANAAARFLESPSEDSLLEALEAELEPHVQAPRKR